MRKILFGALACALAISPIAAKADSVSRGAARGAHEGSEALGVPGAVVGGVVGGVAGAVGGILGADEQPHFRTYVMEQDRPSYHWGHRVAVGAVLPADGVEYYEVPDRFHVRGYRYTIVNDQVVLVDPRTRRIVEVIGG